MSIARGWAAAAAGWLGLATLAAAAGPPKPNVVFILADDLGATDLACAGSGYYRTPNLDRMAAEGVRFTDGCTAGPNCQPTRAALMSGQYGPRTGIYTVGATSRFDTRSRPLVPVENVETLNPRVVTFAEALKGAGYATGLFGKWHLGQDPAHHPRAQGFDEAIVSMGQHFDFRTTPETAYPPGTYLADFLTDRAIDFIARHKDGPFLLCLHHFAVHSPLQAKPELIDKFKGVPPAGGHGNPTYAAMIASVDESVGRVLEALKREGLDANTLVIFTSDNGGVGGYAAAGVEGGGRTTDNAPYRGGKGMLYEGGVRVPWIARWPGTIAPGRVDPTPFVSVDLYPTLLDLAGAKAPDPAAQPLDGVSLAPVLKGTGTLPERDLFWHFPGYLGAGPGAWRTTPAAAIRRGDWKLVTSFEDGRRELYNLKADPGQKRDLAAAEPERLAAMAARLAEWQKSVNAPMPTKRTGDEPAPSRKAQRKAARKAAAKANAGGDDPS
jgi:arylsulfatase A-like enzyme